MLDFISQYLPLVLRPLTIIENMYTNDLYGFATGSKIVLSIFLVYRFFLAPIIGTVGSDTVKAYRNKQKSNSSNKNNPWGV